jgi:hypothetical protein
MDTFPVVAAANQPRGLALNSDDRRRLSPHPVPQ